MNEFIEMSPEEVDWCRNPITSHEDAGLRLAAEVIINAIEDYRILCKAGQIVNGAVPEHCLIGPQSDGTVNRSFKPPWNSRAHGYLHEREVLELIEFFRTDQLERWLNYAQFNVSAGVIRERLGIIL